jgi:hypothetical protein
MSTQFDPESVARHVRTYMGEPVTITHAALGSIHVHSFLDQPVHGSVTHVTVGLSRRVLQQESGLVRQELLLSADASWESPAIAGLLAYVAGSVSLAGRPLLWGEAFPLEQPLGELLRIPALLSIDPRYFDDGLATFRGTDPPTDISWLVPITTGEWEFVTTRGADAFLDLVATEQPNLLKVRSTSVRGAGCM